MIWRTGAILALVAALLLAALPAYATPPGGDAPATAVELTGMKVGDNFYFDTKSGSLKAGQEAFYKVYDSGTNKPLGVTLNYRPWTPEAWPSATIEDPMVMFAVWTPVWADGQWKLKEVGNSTPSAQPSGVKYWRGGTNVARTYYIQMRNYGPMAIDYAIAFTGPLYPPPSLDIKPMAEAKANLMTSEKASLGKFLVDSAGKTLYTFTKDSPGMSTCYDACATNWPVFFAEKPMPGAGMMASDFATITRTDGKKQTTYKGWPLYYWAKDMAKGDTTGHGVNGVWFVANTTPMKRMDIIDTAVGAGSFKTLAAALTAAGLIDTLKGAGPFTVLAPTDEAFGKLPAGTVENLLKPENIDMLKAVLTYHVVPGRAYSETVVGLKEAPTVNGQKVNISIVGGKVMLDGAATVVKTDIDCTNGVIHVIDQVILPK